MQCKKFLHAKTLAHAALIAALSFPVSLAMADEKLVDPPRTVLNQAQTLLKLVDAGKYAEAYRQLSAETQKKSSVEKMTKNITDRRKPLGELRSRKLMCAIEHSFKTTKGRSLYVYFATSFAAAPDEVEESAAFISEGDGPWVLRDFTVQTIPISKFISMKSEPNCIRLKKKQK